MRPEQQPIATVIPFRNQGPTTSVVWDPSCLDGLLQGLSGVEKVTEKRFLEFGHNIDSLHASAKNISRLAGEVLDVLNGDGGERSVHHLQLVVERCNLWLDSTNKKSTEICLHLKEVLSQINELELPVLGLRKVIKTLHSLRVSTRIEASKGYASGAGVLAKSLDELGSLVQDKVLEIFDRLETLVPVIQRSVAMEQSAQNGSIREASIEVGKAREFLGRFLKTCVETNQWSDRLKERSEGVATSFSEIVAALQFQDITRQRLEHVQKALTNLGVHLEKFSLRTDFSKDVQAERLFGCICKLQHDQLEYATNEFVSAADKLSENLQNMSSNVMSMAADTRELVRVSDDDSDNRYAVVLHALQSIPEYLEKTGEIHDRTVANLSEVTEGVKQVSLLVEEIEFVSEEMQLLAINAAISAAHARQMGAGLDVIAQNIQEVAEEACTQAVMLSERCAMIADHANRLQDLEEDNHSGGDVGALLQEANDRMKCFDASHTTLTALAGQIDADAGVLSLEAAKIVSGLHIGEVFKNKIAPVMERFKELIQNRGESLSETDSASLEALFKELELCYTMASERKVHQKFVEGQQIKADVMNSHDEDWPGGQQHNLGDNVDLF